MLFDSHCHINFNAYKEDADEVIKRSLDMGIDIINIGSQYSTSQRTIEIAEKYDKGVYAVVGLHPIHLAEDITETATFNNKEYKFTTKKEEFDKNKYKELAKSSDKVVGLGESGLDYWYYDQKTPEEFKEIEKVQKEVFRGFIELAIELDLPLVIHGRGTKEDPYGAYDDMLGIVSEYPKLRGVVHCFGGNLEQAKKFVDLGFYIGFTGIVTFRKKSEDLQEIARQIPLEKILVETDAPFLTPEPHRGKRNEPSYVKHVAEKIAEIKNERYAIVEDVTTENVKKLFKV